MSADNGIWLCQTCAKLVDNDEKRFPSDVLRLWKAEAEAAASNRVGKPLNTAESHFSPIATQRVRLVTAFAETLGSLNSGNGDTFNLLASHRKTHDAALAEFRYHIPQESREAFDQAVREFHSIREQTQPAITAFYREMVGRTSVLTEDVIKGAIERLLAFAE